MANTPQTETRARTSPTAPETPNAEATVLYSPAGTEYHTSSPREITRLKARGYSTEKPEPKKS